MHDSPKLELAGYRKAVSHAAAWMLWAPGGGFAAGLWRRFLKDLVKPYRPELHYMRGPGPKWREKHGGPATH